MKRGHWQILLAAALFLLALGLTLYPVVSNWYIGRHQSRIQTEYREMLEQTDSAEIESIRESAVAYNKTITPGAAEEAYSQASIRLAAEDYVNQLNVSGSGIMGYVEIPKIGVDLPIYHGTGADSLDRGMGHLLGSSLPVGGESTHTIITGHSGMASQKMFTDLEQLRELLRKDTVLVSVCAADSELGTVQPIREIGTILKEYPDCRLHVDATQAVGKAELVLDGVDTFHAPTM